MSPELQAAFAEAVLRGEPQAVADALAASRLTEARSRAALHIHASTTRETLTQALRDSFPTVARRLSDRRFTKLAADHIRQSPPRQAALWYWGEDFPAFLADRGLDAATIALARLDRAWHEAFAAEDAKSVTIADIVGLPSETLTLVRLRFHTAARLLTLPTGVLRQWRSLAALPHDAPPLDVLNAGHVLITRPEVAVAVTTLHAGEAAFARAIGDGQTLLDAFETVPGQEPFDLRAALGRLLGAGAFTLPS